MAVVKQAVSAILVVERDKEQIPAYYVSCILAYLELNYPSIEKFTNALELAR